MLTQKAVTEEGSVLRGGGKCVGLRVRRLLLPARRPQAGPLVPVTTIKLIFNACLLPGGTIRMKGKERSGMAASVLEEPHRLVTRLWEDKGLTFPKDRNHSRSRKRPERKSEGDDR